MERPPDPPPKPEHEPEAGPKKRRLWPWIGAAALVLASALSIAVHQHNQRPGAPLLTHHDITTTMFWVGEEGNASNAGISNAPSAWVENWQSEFGGVDDPNNRCNMLPCDFKPKENAWYAAVPLNDLDESCQAKPWQKDIPWVKGPLPEGESAIKNHWIQIHHDNKIAFAQIEDAGPFGEDDKDYVLGKARPQARAGLDLSPAVAEYLKLDGEGQTSWEFVDENDVPNGPWRDTIATSLPDCAR